VATRIAYDLPVRSKVLLSIYDVDGRQVARLADGWQEAGRYNLKWDGRDKRGRACPTGVYFCSLRTEDAAAVRKMLIAE
jgi:flagellar hook assembly protein FlgD